MSICGPSLKATVSFLHQHALPLPFPVVVTRDYSPVLLNLSFTLQISFSYYSYTSSDFSCCPLCFLPLLLPTPTCQWNWHCANIESSFCFKQHIVNSLSETESASEAFFDWNFSVCCCWYSRASQCCLSCDSNFFLAVFLCALQYLISWIAYEAAWPMPKYDLFYTNILQLAKSPNFTQG